MMTEHCGSRLGPVLLDLASSLWWPCPQAGGWITAPVQASPTGMTAPGFHGKEVVSLQDTDSRVGKQFQVASRELPLTAHSSFTRISSPAPARTGAQNPEQIPGAEHGGPDWAGALRLPVESGPVTNPKLPHWGQGWNRYQGTNYREIPGYFIPGSRRNTQFYWVLISLFKYLQINKMTHYSFIIQIIAYK